jgi:hypothetical protein
MERTKTALAVIAALLLPGGSLLLGWMLGRRLLKRVLPLLVAFFVQGCATQLDLRSGASFQKYSAAPAAEDVFVGKEALRPGDILLTSMPGFAGKGIELMTIAPVSHAALYLGEGRVVEAVRSGVGERTIEQVLQEESLALVLRHPELSPGQAERIREYAQGKEGAGFNFVGVTLQIPFTLARRLCELPLVPLELRHACLQGMGVLSQLGFREQRLFCSQLVLQAYRHAGVELTAADPRLMSPADILHMREGDVPSVRIAVPLRHVGHLKYDRPVLTADAH